MKFLVTCAPGLETLLENELKEMGLTPQIAGLGVLSIESESWDSAFQVLLWSRIASRVLLSLREFAAKNEAMLYDQVRRIDWLQLAKVAQTLAVHAHGSNETYPITFATLKIKDAICDAFRKLGIDRPSIDRQDPDLRIEAFFKSGRCEISADLSGLPLHRRGYREESGFAPLRENRAAALLRFAGYTGAEKLIDPFCGSGTIAIEAALIASGRAPGTLRSAGSYKFVHLFPDIGEKFVKAHQLALRTEEKTSQNNGQKSATILLRDTSKKMLGQAKDNAKRAGVAHLMKFEMADARTLEEPNSLIVTNPPYGIRLDDEEAASLIAEFTRQVKHHCAPSKLVFILPKGDLMKSVGFKPEGQRIFLRSGELDMQFVKFNIREGKFRSAPQT